MPGAKIPQDWDGTTWECWSVEWPSSQDWLAILQGFLSTPRLGRYWDGETGSITGVQVTGREIADRNKILKECLMSCNEDTLALFDRMADALEALVAKPCCPPSGGTSGSRGSGQTDNPENPYNQATSDGTPPPGFPSNSQWKAHQCNQAADIINGLKADLVSLSGLTYSGTSVNIIAGALVGLLLTPIPFDEIVGLVAYLIYTGLNYALLSQMSSAITANEGELLCILYNAKTVGEAQGDFSDKLQEIAEATFTLVPDQEFVMGAIDWFLTNDSFNRLFEPGVTIAQDADCSECGGGTLYQVLTYGGCTPELLEGAFFPSEETQIESCETAIYGDTRANCLLATTFAGTNRRVEIISASGANSGMYLDMYDAGVHQTPIPYTNLSDLIGEVYEASSLHFSRLALNDVNPYSITVVVTEL